MEFAETLIREQFNLFTFSFRLLHGNDACDLTFIALQHNIKSKSVILNRIDFSIASLSRTRSPTFFPCRIFTRDHDDHDDDDDNHFHYHFAAAATDNFEQREAA